MIQVDLNPETKHLDPDFNRKVREAKVACKEAAGWRCEYIHPNGQRCRATEGQLKRKKGRNGRPDGWSVTHMHGCHADQDRLNAHPRLICLCPKHHFEFDRNSELKDQMKMYRRGYQLTSTDALLAHLVFTGICISEMTDGYAWSIDGTELQGHRTTAIFAVGAAIYQLRSLQAQTQTDLLSAQDTIQQLEKQLATEHKLTQALLFHLALLSKSSTSQKGTDMHTEQLIQGGIPQCECGHFLRTENEQAKRRCLECGIQTALTQAPPHPAEIQYVEAGSAQQ